MITFNKRTYDDDDDANCSLNEYLFLAKSVKIAVPARIESIISVICPTGVHKLCSWLQNALQSKGVPSRPLVRPSHDNKITHTLCVFHRNGKIATRSPPVGESGKMPCRATIDQKSPDSAFSSVFLTSVNFDRR